MFSASLTVLSKNDNMLKTGVNGQKHNGIRYPLIDAVRGACVLGMIVYHALFDIAELFGFGVEKFVSFVPLLLVRDIGAGLFIFLSGICSHFSRRPFTRFAVLFVGGLVVSAATLIAAPESAVLFGILTFMSVSGLLLFFLNRYCRLYRLPPKVFCVINLCLFVFFLRMNYAYVGTYSHVWFYLPQALYRSYVTAFFGFPFNGFSSGDYFPLFPWFFACLAGYFFYGAVKNSEKIKRAVCVRIPVLTQVGRYSFIVYLIHQPVLYGFIWLLSHLWGAN